MKQILIVVSSFFIILWLQTKEDKRNNRVKNTPYEKFKFPILVSSMIGLLFTMKEFICKQSIDTTVISSTEMPKEFIPMKKGLETISEGGQPTRVNYSRNSLSDFDQEIDLGPPDF